MNADASRRNGYFARVASSTSEGTPRGHKRPTRRPAKRELRIGRELHSVSGAPGGGGATPSCTIRPATSHCPQCSVLWPFSNRVMSIHEISTAFPFAEQPLTSPVWVPVIV